MKDKFLWWDVLFSPITAEQTLNSAVQPSNNNILSFLFGNLFLVTAVTQMFYPYFCLGSSFIASIPLAKRFLMVDAALTGFAGVEIVTFAGSMVIHKKIDRKKAGLIAGLWTYLISSGSMYAFYKSLNPDANLLYILQNFFGFALTKS